MFGADEKKKIECPAENPAKGNESWAATQQTKEKDNVHLHSCAFKSYTDAKLHSIRHFNRDRLFCNALQLKVEQFSAYKQNLKQTKKQGRYWRKA